MKRIKKATISTFTIVISLLFLINNRTPFFTPKKGGWSIGYSFYDSLPSKLKVDKNQIFSIDKMMKINDSTVFLADPFFITAKDTIYVFFEYQMKKNGADIAVMKSVDGVNFKYDRIVLDENFHLSYPNVFNYKGSYYMLPETKSANNILLYKAHNFPYDWRINDTLIKNIRLKDPSIYLSDSLNFILASDDELNLHMYESDSLFGKWKINKNKSLVSFGTESRPAGRIFLNKGKITVPMQNCTHGYGYGVSLYELDFSKKKDYEYKLSSKFFLKANKRIKEFSGGMHHIDIQKHKSQYFIVYDGNHLKGTNQKVFNWKFPLKASYLDTKNYVYQLFN
jgi:hypothetical protein